MVFEEKEPELLTIYEYPRQTWIAGQQGELDGTARNN